MPIHYNIGNTQKTPYHVVFVQRNNTSAIQFTSKTDNPFLQTYSEESLWSVPLPFTAKAKALLYMRHLKRQF